MKKLSKLAALILGVVLVSVFASCKGEVVTEYVTKEVDKKADETAPSSVTNLTAIAKDSRVLLTWTNAADNDIYGYEVSYSGTSAINRVVISALDTTSMMVPQGAGGTYVSGLTNGREYTFTVKSVDTSGNKSEGVTVKATPLAPSAGETLKIALTADVPHENGYSGNKSNSKVIVTANITTASTVKKVVWKKDGSLIARTLLADTDATAATVSSDNKKWTFDINATDEAANGTYTVAAIDEAGREEAEQIVIDNFDFTPPKRVSIENSVYTSELSAIILNWSEPSDLDYNHVIITYTMNNGTQDSAPSEPIKVAKGTSNKTFTNIDSNADYYTFILESIDNLGNTSSLRLHKVSVKKFIRNVPEEFVEIIGATVNGAISDSKVFIEGRSITIDDLFVCDHETTQKEYETYCIYADTYDDETKIPDEKYGKGNNYPAYYVSYYDAIVYCNLRSIAEGLSPVYQLEGESDPRKWQYITVENNNEVVKYCGPDRDWYGVDDIWGKITMTGNSATKVTTANGYRLPTEAEWEYIARGGNRGIPMLQTTYAGSNELEEVAWPRTEGNNCLHEVKGKNPISDKNKIYDMSGNVCEMCFDWYNEPLQSDTPLFGPEPIKSRKGHVMRGGSLFSEEAEQSVFDRAIVGPRGWYNWIGFRVVRNAN